MLFDASQSVVQSKLSPYKVSPDVYKAALRQPRVPLGFLVGLGQFREWSLAVLVSECELETG